MKQTSKETERKYRAFIEECFHKKTFDSNELIRKHRVDAALITTLKHLGIIVTVRRGVHNWTGPITIEEPSINTIIECHRDKMKAYKERRKGNASENPMPVITEEQAVSFLKSLGCYEIYKVERKQV